MIKKKKKKKHGRQVVGAGGARLIFPVYLYRINFLSEPIGPISILLGRNVPLVTSTKIVQAIMICRKHGCYGARLIYITK